MNDSIKTQIIEDAPMQVCPICDIGGCQHIRETGSQPAQSVSVKVKPLDVSHILHHAFLAGFVAAREIPAGDECDGRELWLDFDPTVNPAYQRIMAALDVQPLTVQDAARVILKQMPQEHDCWEVMQNSIDAGQDVGDIMRAVLRAIVEGK